MRVNDNAVSPVSDFACWLTMALFVVGFSLLAVKLKEVQVDAAADYGLQKERQSIRRIQTAGARGRICDRSGRILADNRRSTSIVCRPSAFQRRTWSATADAIAARIANVGAVVGRTSALTPRDIRRHVDLSLSMPLFVWRDVSDAELARFCEHSVELPGFDVVETDERVYPFGALAAHTIGYVGRDRGETMAGDVPFSFCESELRGRAGIEYYYDSYLRGAAGERDVVVDARGFATSERIVTEAGRGLDLTLTLDVAVQRCVETQLAGCRGACVVIDPRTGDVLAMASSPGYDLNGLVPTLSHEHYGALQSDPGKPLLNRATAGTYAPGSTFKPVTALAGLELGYPADERYTCTGTFEFGGMTLRCSRRWGHGPLTLREALRDSCNGFFCNLGCEIGTNSLCRMARKFGLGSKTGIDYPDERCGVVPDAGWKMRMYRERWYPGDLAQMAIGQGMLLVTPLQMAVVAGALGTGWLARPRLRFDERVTVSRLEVSARDLDVVREGMRMVVASSDGGGVRGTGWRGALGVDASVIGKTGTAEVGRGERRRKNTWFIAFAESRDRHLAVSVAMVIENGVSGGGTTAPKVAEVLKTMFGEARG